MRDFREKSEKVNALYAQFRKDDAEQMFADFKELMKLGAFRRVLIGMTKRGMLEKSLPDTQDPSVTAKWIGYREFAVQLAESAKQADFESWQLAERERKYIDDERKRRIDILTGNETKGNEQ